MKHTDEVKGAAGLVGAAFIYSFFGILTRTIGFAIPVFYGSFVRQLVSLAILAIPLFGKRLWAPIKYKDLPWFFLRSVGGFFGYIGSYFAFYYIPIGTAYFIFYGGSTIAGYFFGKTLLGEKLTKLKVISLLLALAGLILIYIQSIGGGNPLYMGMAFIAGVGTGTWYTFSKKISGRYSDVQLNFTDFSFSCIFMLVLSLIFREQWVAPAFNVLWLANALFILMFISTGQLIVYGFRRLDAQIGSLIMLMEVLFGVVLAYLFYREIPSVWAFVGGALIITAIVLPEIRWKRKVT
jgi:drug/metabolite transporter (DMT)-like permease